MGFFWCHKCRRSIPDTGPGEVIWTRGGRFACGDNLDACAERQKWWALKLTTPMREVLNYLVNHDMGHSGNHGPNTMRALVRRKLIEFICWGGDDTHGKDEVELYRITDAGRWAQENQP